MKESEKPVEELKDSDLIVEESAKTVSTATSVASVTPETIKPVKPVKKTPIWDSFKVQKVSLFNLPKEEVSKYVELLNETPTACVVTFKLPALPSFLEASIDSFSFEVIDRTKLEVKRKV